MRTQRLAFSQLHEELEVLNFKEANQIKGGLFVLNPYSNTSVFRVDENTGEVTLLEAPPGLVWNPMTEYFDFPFEVGWAPEDDTLTKTENGQKYISFDNGVTWIATLNEVEIFGPSPSTSNQGLIDMYLASLGNLYSFLFGGGNGNNGGSGSGGGYSGGGGNGDDGNGGSSNSGNTSTFSSSIFSQTFFENLGTYASIGELTAIAKNNATAAKAFGYLGFGAQVGGFILDVDALKDFYNNNTGNMDGVRFTIRTAGTSIAIIEASVVGGAPGVLIGVTAAASVATGEMLYDAFNYWRSEVSAGMTQYELMLSCGWIPGT